MPAHVRYADRSRSRLAKRDRVAETKTTPKSELKVDAEKIEGATKIEQPPVEAPKVEEPEPQPKPEEPGPQPKQDNPEN